MLRKSNSGSTEPTETIDVRQPDNRAPRNKHHVKCCRFGDRGRRVVKVRLHEPRSLPDGKPGFFAPYFSREAVVLEEAHDYIEETTTVANATTYTWVHPLGDIISALLRAGMSLDWLHEHDGVTWHLFDALVRGADGLWRWPDKPWLPLAFSLRATRR